MIQNNYFWILDANRSINQMMLSTMEGERVPNMIHYGEIVQYQRAKFSKTLGLVQ